MKIMKKIGLMVLALLLGVQGAQAFCGNGDCEGREGPRNHAKVEMRHLKSILRDLDLSDAQKDSIWALLKQAKKDAKVVRNGQKGKRENMRDLVESGASDAEIDAAVAKMAKDMKVRLKAKAKLFREIRALLTKDQIADFEKALKKRPQHPPRGKGKRDRCDD